MSGETMIEKVRASNAPLSLMLAGRQRSHVLFVLSDSVDPQDARFLEWYRGPYRDEVGRSPAVVGVQHYRQHDVDITQGVMSRLPFRYLGIYQIVLDGAREATALIGKIAMLHEQQSFARSPATWLYYPLSEKVGRAPTSSPSMLTIAFANSTPGDDAEFQEWYATRHIRHALNVPELVSGQCFARTQFQSPGALEAKFQMIAVYEQEGTPADILKSFEVIPESVFQFPTLDTTRFAEWVYGPV